VLHERQWSWHSSLCEGKRSGAVIQAERPTYPYPRVHRGVKCQSYGVCQVSSWCCWKVRHVRASGRDPTPVWEVIRANWTVGVSFLRVCRKRSDAGILKRSNWSIVGDGFVCYGMLELSEATSPGLPLAETCKNLKRIAFPSPLGWLSGSGGGVSTGVHPMPTSRSSAWKMMVRNCM
jgi:hypothetical protein